MSMRRRQEPRRPSTREYLALTTSGKQDIRAHQRTFEGAYLRTALGQLSFSLIILKMFSKEFLPIGTMITGYGLLVMLIALYRRKQMAPLFLASKQQPNRLVEHFETSGNVVLLLGILSIALYVLLIALLLRLDLKGSGT